MPRITPARLDRLQQLDAERLDLGRRAKALKAEIEQIEAEAAADLTATGRNSCKRGGYVLRWTEEKLSVSWKSEFVRVAGSDEADRIAKEVEKKRVLEIVAPAPVAAEPAAAK